MTVVFSQNRRLAEASARPDRLEGEFALISTSAAAVGQLPAHFRILVSPGSFGVREPLARSDINQNHIAQG